MTWYPRKNKSFIVDSGASSHFIAKKDLTRAERRRIKRIPVVATFQSANGVIETNEVVDLFSEDLGIPVQAYVVTDSPTLISLGKLVNEWKLCFCKAFIEKQAIRDKECH